MMAAADEPDGGRRPRALAPRKAPEVPVTQGNGPEIGAFHRSVPCDEPYG